MPEQFGEKVHDPTPRRREQAREQGQVVRSQDLASAALLIGGTLVLLFLGGSLVQFFGKLAAKQLGGDAWLHADQDFVAVFSWELFGELGRVLLPMLGVVLLVAIAVNLAQTGLLFLPDKLNLDASRIDPLKGLQRIFAVSNVVRLMFGIFKIAVVSVVAFWCLWSARDEIAAVANMDVPSLAAYVVELTIWTCLKIGMALLILALLDYGYQYWRQEGELRMTHQELREEIRNMQGDPQILARRRAVQRQMASSRINTAVPKADVVVTNPTELAVALQYDPETMAAPIVVAKGAGVVAARIRKLALENNVPVVERKELARALYKDVEVNQQVPFEQYAAVAEVLKYVYQLKGKKI